MLQSESLLEEDGKLYEVLHALRESDRCERDQRAAVRSVLLAVRLSEAEKQEWLYRMGPYLLRQRKNCCTANGVMNMQSWSGSARSWRNPSCRNRREKEAQLRKEMNAIEEVLSCLRTDKPSSS